MRRGAILSAMIASAFSFSALATSPELVMPKILSEGEQQGYFKIIDHVNVEEFDDLSAVLVDTGGREYHLYWVHEDGFITGGHLLTTEGGNLTRKYEQRMTPALDLSTNFDQLYDEGVIFGSTDRDDSGAMYVIYEPHCGYCKNFHAELQPYIEQGLDLRLIPVSFLRANSPDIISAVANAEVPFEALKRFDQTGQFDSVPVTGQLRSQLAANSNFMRDIGVRGTPGVIYKQDGQYVITGALRGNQLKNVADKLMAQ
ncbi:thioredoxin fold domain-containing protein [Photobacterium sp. ZSDE20]|uniref:Thioredoxin fold domain-containing protein n=1 Tax=Photobacterium pectinilyticum TaxID=2906793 RepID=A0ABT1N6C5_9GAMM|nr:thioredoxin fold domain-containing protein [Photobacterium sp. ZSDE20]MCQ1060271.1 thioredoxin fold domain-containing protein [Photobacterium sp. ZSDE20]MDD1826258.1 thioredoxin fold domain-containing protein [Photobacterium sp. ZSDE20]